MPEYINNPILGKQKVPTEEERLLIKNIVEDCPLGVFQELNKHFNSIGLQLLINTRLELQTETKS